MLLGKHAFSCLVTKRSAQSASRPVSSLRGHFDHSTLRRNPLKTRFTYTEIFDEAKNQSCTPGSKLGTMARNGAATVDAAAKAGVSLATVYGVTAAGRIAGFVQGF
jgi:hypothetical protein